jgi:hypothetical protein
MLHCLRIDKKLGALFMLEWEMKLLAAPAEVPHLSHLKSTWLLPEESQHAAMG